MQNTPKCMFAAVVYLFFSQSSLTEDLFMISRGLEFVSAIANQGGARFYHGRATRTRSFHSLADNASGGNQVRLRHVPPCLAHPIIFSTFVANVGTISNACFTCGSVAGYLTHLLGSAREPYQSHPLCDIGCPPIYGEIRLSLDNPPASAVGRKLELLQAG